MPNDLINIGNPSSVCCGQRRLEKYSDCSSHIYSLSNEVYPSRERSRSFTVDEPPERFRYSVAGLNLLRRPVTPLGKQLCLLLVHKATDTLCYFLPLRSLLVNMIAPTCECAVQVSIQQLRDAAPHLVAVINQRFHMTHPGVKRRRNFSIAQFLQHFLQPSTSCHRMFNIVPPRRKRSAQTAIQYLRQALPHDPPMRHTLRGVLAPRCKGLQERRIQ